MIDVLLKSVWGIQKGLTRPSTQAKIVRPMPGHNCLGSNTMTASLVTPGMQVSTTSDCEAGEGTVEVDGRILATMIGNFSINDGIGTVIAVKEVLTPSVGDTVICQIEKLNEKNGEARILCIEGKSGDLLPEHLYGHFHVTGLVDRYMHQTADAVRRRDICRAQIKEIAPVVRIDFRERDDCGVLHAICPSCGDTLVAEAQGDWNVNCNSCEYRSFRALADNFAAGWAELDQGASVLNNSGKRWGSEAEALFAKGPSGRATFIAEDFREDGRERNYFRFEGQQSGGGQRQNAKPGCKLFVGGLPREIGTEELREMFSKFGDMADCFVPTDDSGANRGFGFVTYHEKSVAEAAAKELDGHRINGRRIGVRDADSDDKKGKKNNRRDVDGMKFYVGNLPFKAEDSTLKELFGKFGTVVDVNIITDNGGRPKGFAFVTLKEKDKGDEVIQQLNGTEVLGRKIRVDVSQKKSGGQKDGKPKKSSRELRAMREESEDSKKRKRKPRHKKD